MADGSSMPAKKRTNAATTLFNIPELLELILLHLPWDPPFEEIYSTRFIMLAQTVSRTWQRAIQSSTPIRDLLYLPSPTDTTLANLWLRKTASRPACPNPWIPHLLLHQRSWGSAYPFDNTYSAYNLDPSSPKLWTFALEISRAQYERFPSGSTWRRMLLTKQPFYHMWYTRAFYELGSGRAPFVTYIDYEPTVPKWDQKYSCHCEEGVTLGDVVDAVGALFEQRSSNYVKWVRIESVRRPPAGREGEEAYKDATDGMPRTRDLLPTSSATLWNQHFGES